MVMKRDERLRYALKVLVIYGVWAVLYTAIAAWASTRETSSLETSIDRMIPFVPEFEYFYLLCYVLPIVPIFLIDNRGRFNRLIAAFVATSSIAFTVFVPFPVYCPRPVFPVDSLATILVSFEHMLDRPINNFPSLHAANALLIFVYCRGGSRSLDILLGIAVAGICVGALFVKQHFVADILAGLLLSGIVAFVVEHWPSPVPTPSDRDQGVYDE